MRVISFNIEEVESLLEIAKKWLNKWNNCSFCGVATPFLMSLAIGNRCHQATPVAIGVVTGVDPLLWWKI